MDCVGQCLIGTDANRRGFSRLSSYPHGLSRRFANGPCWRGDTNHIPNKESPKVGPTPPSTTNWSAGAGSRPAHVRRASHRGRTCSSRLRGTVGSAHPVEPLTIGWSSTVSDPAVEDAAVGLFAAASGSERLRAGDPAPITGTLGACALGNDARPGRRARGLADASVGHEATGCVRTSRLPPPRSVW